jgi:hypothetical protein
MDISFSMSIWIFFLLKPLLNWEYQKTLIINMWIIF